MKNTKKENVYENIAETEEIATAKQEAASTVLGKFKSVDALVRAYGSLQAEFTRRSQRLKELEREAEDRNRLDGAKELGVEKLRKNAQTHRAAAKQFDEFLSEIGQPIAENGEKDDAATVTPAGSDAETTPEKEPTITAVSTGECVDKTNDAEDGSVGEKEKVCKDAVSKGAKAVSPVALGGESLSSEELYEKVRLDEGVRLRVIGEYLSSIGKTDVPLTLGGVTAPLTPPKRARSIGAAGTMALQYFKNRTGDVNG